MPSSASLRIPLNTSEPEKVSDMAGCDGSGSGSCALRLESSLGESSNRTSRRSKGADDREPEVPKRECTASLRFLEACVVSLDSGFVLGLVSSFSVVLFVLLVWFMYSSGETMLDGRGSSGLPSTTASAKILNAPLAAFDRLGPLRESNAWRLFADKDVAFKLYLS